MKKIISIELPDGIGEDIIKHAAALRRNENRNKAKQSGETSFADPNLSDEDYIIADVRAGLIAHYTQVEVARAAQEAQKITKAEIQKKLKEAE